MLRVAATLLAALAAIPAVSSMIGGHKVFNNECRNLTHISPGKWPETPSRTYNFTGLLIMPEHTCSCSLVTAKFFLSCSLCRYWKENLDLSNDIEDDGSEVRLGIIQGEISPDLYQCQPVKQYYHYEKLRTEIRRDPFMLIEVYDPFEGWNEENYPGLIRSVWSSTASADSQLYDVVGYENSVNMQVYHQSVFDVHLNFYYLCKLYGRKKWDLSSKAVCTWDVSPVRTVCIMDRGGPIVLKKQIYGIIIGFIDDTEKSENHCGEGRIHYNIFMRLENVTLWIRKITESQARIVNLLEGRIMEDCDDAEGGGRPAKPVTKPPSKPIRPTKKPSKGRSGAEQQIPSVEPLLLAAAATIARLVNQY